MAWHSKEVLRSIYDITNPDLAHDFVAQPGVDLQDADCPAEVHQLGRTILRWKDQIAGRIRPSSRTPRPKQRTT